jgi:hypothetical protein
MRTIKILLVLYIGIISVVVFIFDIMGIIESGFVLNNYFSSVIEILLTIFGVIILTIFLIKRFKINSFLLLIWWMPQLISIIIKTFDFTNTLLSANVLYQVKVLFSVSYGWGWTMSANRYLTINFNLIALVALILTVLLIKEESVIRNEG